MLSVLCIACDKELVSANVGCVEYEEHGPKTSRWLRLRDGQVVAAENRSPQPKQANQGIVAGATELEW
jgi:hypothetical protein